MVVVQVVRLRHVLVVPAIVADFTAAYQEDGNAAWIKSVQNPVWFASVLNPEFPHMAMTGGLDPSQPMDEYNHIVV